jgi:hypothetical protein
MTCSWIMGACIDTVERGKMNRDAVSNKMFNLGDTTEGPAAYILMLVCVGAFLPSKVVHWKCIRLLVDTRERRPIDSIFCYLSPMCTIDVGRTTILDRDTIWVVRRPVVGLYSPQSQISGSIYAQGTDGAFKCSHVLHSFNPTTCPTGVLHFYYQLPKVCIPHACVMPSHVFHPHRSTAACTVSRLTSSCRFAAAYIKSR